MQNMRKASQFDRFKYVDILQKDVSYFLAAAETLNISKASELLGIQQSGLSKAVLRMEQDIGQKLFQRKNNGLVLTEEGHRVFQAVKMTKLCWEANFNLLLQESETPAGLIKIGFHTSFGQNFFPKISQRISSLFPQVEIEVHTLNSHQVVRKILDNEIDFGLVISKIKSPEIVQKRIGEDFLSTYQKNVKLSPTHLLLNPETQLSGPILKKYNSLKRVTIKDYDLIAKTALENNYAALLPHSVAKNYPSLQQTGGKLIKADISLICHLQKLKSKTGKIIYDEILSSCKSISTPLNS